MNNYCCTCKFFKEEEDAYCNHYQECYMSEGRGLPSWYVKRDTKNEKMDTINPKHYQRDDAMECIDEMILVFGKEKVKAFCLCNVWKYRYRAADKNGSEDLEKSDWYMKKYQELDKIPTYSTLTTNSLGGNSIINCLDTIKRD